MPTAGRVVSERSAWVGLRDLLPKCDDRSLRAHRGRVINHTRDPMLRLDVPLAISYDSDIREARRVLLEAVAGYELMAEEPPPDVVVAALGDSSVDLMLRVYLNDAREERKAMWQLLELAKNSLDDAGIVIPFPQRTLHWSPPSGGPSSTTE